MNPLLALGAVAVGKAAYDHVTTSKHDRVLKRTYKVVNRHTSGDATLYVDHIGVTDETPAGAVANVNGIPDLVLTQQSGRNLIVEVETADSVENGAGHIVEQLTDFATPGFRRVLVVPDDARPAARSVLEANDLDDAVTVTTSAGIKAQL